MAFSEHLNFNITNAILKNISPNFATSRIVQLAIHAKYTLPNRTLFFHIFTYLRAISHWIMAQMRHYIIFLSLKPIKVILDFIFNYLKKVVGGASTQKYQKQTQKPWYLHYGCAPRGAIGVKNTGKTKGSKPWCVFALIFS